MKTLDTEQNLYFYYRFVFKDGREKYFEINIDGDTLEVIRDENKKFPEWTLTKEFGCAHCERHRGDNYCPVAMNLHEVIDFFTDTPSYEKAEIYVSTNERQYYKYISVQMGVSSMIGILMAASGCPDLKYMKPLLRYHLPFSSLEETEFRVLSMYLLAQYFRMKNGKEPDWNFDGLRKIYQNIQKVNQNIARRIADLEKRDTSINAVVVLNNFADFVTFSIDEKDLGHLEKLFKMYIE